MDEQARLSDVAMCGPAARRNERGHGSVRWEQLVLDRTASAARRANRITAATSATLADVADLGARRDGWSFA